MLSPENAKIVFAGLALVFAGLAIRNLEQICEEQQALLTEVAADNMRLRFHIMENQTEENE